MSKEIANLILEKNFFIGAEEGQNSEVMFALTETAGSGSNPRSGVIKKKKLLS